MNDLSRVLEQSVREAEKQYGEVAAHSKYRMKYHLMPPVGWLNDPNGLCQYQGVYHVFFQYSPFDTQGGLKVWGHYTSKDMVHFQYEGAPVLADQPFDCHGVYSGSSFVKKDGFSIFYTGNVKYDGDYDYILQGRGSNVIRMDTTDGMTFGEKKLLLSNEDYPKECTAHVRDPKIYIGKDGAYRMVLGARLRDDKGAVLIYRSEDLEKFTFEKLETTKETFGYMWECPDIFQLEGENFLSVSPQGLLSESYRYQNIYQSGYFAEGEEAFTEWDMGFDFYAPQSFEDDSGRRILIGWAGVPDADYTCKSVKDHWQHSLTLPRKLIRQGKHILQYPLEELSTLHTEKLVKNVDGMIHLKEFCGDIFMENITGAGKVLFGDACELIFDQEEICLRFLDDSGAGRGQRHARVNGVRQIRMLLDVSIMEIYVNYGETVLTSRIFLEDTDIPIRIEADTDCTAYQMG